MKYLLDSNVCVDYLTGRFPQVKRRIQSLLPDDLCISSIVVAELRYVPTNAVRRNLTSRRVDG
jgi:predicted nucleic acid-binding protein